MPEPKSFLGTVKAEIDEQFATAYDDLSQSSLNPEQTASQLVTLRKKTWEVVEKALKTSYRNGQKAAGKPENGKPPVPADLPPDTKPANPFRKT